VLLVSKGRRAQLSSLLVFVGVSVGANARQPETPAAVSAALADGRFRDVLRETRRDSDSREERLAWAAARIGEQPATDDNMRAAESVLVELERGSDELAAQAAYLRARIYQVHLSEPDYAKAAELYETLAARSPNSHWAQLGLVKLGLLKLYVFPDSTAAGADRLLPAEKILARITEPLLRRDLQFQIGQAGVTLHQPLERLLPHLVEAEKTGGVTGTARLDQIVQLGVLSERAHLWAQAKYYFERMLAEFPTSVRAYTIREKLEAVTKRLAQEGAK
jgi:hypothetical protein